LAQKAPSHIESALAVARAAIDAQEFATARTALAPHLRAPTQRVAMMMAELEEAEHGDEGRAREWTARAVHAQRDSAWTADGFVSDRWLPVSPVSGRLDAFEWKVPVTELSMPRTDTFDKAEEEAPPVLVAPAASAPPLPASAPAQDTPAERETPGTASAAVGREHEAIDTPARAGARPTNSGPATAPLRGTHSAARSRPRPVEAVNPLVHAPDDPGPEPMSEAAPERRHVRDLLN
jgi:HemY protein